MENPEEVLHSLEEFSKMKPKDIPRELEEYLKFVAKTGDPIYQWPAIKSLFREKFINVITEFYESCASVEIPPCPNVDLFNYDLMKNFILEKIDTFASAPFTLQRICELLTSPHKEYTRIDKYMRALEKNILVVSTMEPGGRRTENGEGIMNGIESDHELVPEPGNEINVEEMDDSPYVQTTNHLTEHISEHISFDNPKNDSHIEVENSIDRFTSEKITSEASTSSQEIVCVQYVSIESVTESNTENVVEETKEEDISVTITAVNVKEDNQIPIKPQTVESDDQPTEAILTEGISGSSEAVPDNTNKVEVETESTVHMETEHIDSTEEIPKIENPVTASEPITESDATPSSTTISDKLPEEPDQSQISSDSEAISGSGDNESISPENSIASSENFPCESSCEANALVEVPSSNLNMETSSKESAENLEEPMINTKSDNVEKDTEDSDAVDSTTKASGDDKIECNVTKELENEANEAEIPTEVPLESDIKSAEIIPEVLESTKNDEDQTSNSDNEARVKIDVPLDIPMSTVPVEPLKINEQKEGTSEVSSPKVEEPIESKIEEVSTPSEEKQTPMEVDVVQENSSDMMTKDQQSVDEPQPSEPPENP